MNRLVSPSLALAAGLSLLLPASGLAQPKPAPDARASHLIGATIENEPGWEIGGVDDLIIDPAEGKVLFVVLSAGGRFEVGEQDLALAVPDDNFRYDGRRVWWSENLRALKRQQNTPYALEDLEEARRKRAVSADALIGAPLEDARGERVGQVDDVVVNLADGSVRFVVVDYDLGWLKAGKPVAIERLKDVRRDAEGGLVVRVDRAALEASPAFESQRWPGLSNSRMPQRLERLLSPG